MLDETAEGDLYAALRPREADLNKHLGNGQDEQAKDEARESAREADVEKHLGSGQGEEVKDEVREKPAKMPVSVWKRSPKSR